MRSLVEAAAERRQREQVDDVARELRNGRRGKWDGRRKLMGDWQTRLRQLHAAGMTDDEIAKEMGISATLVGRHRKALGLKPTWGGRR